MPIEIKELNIKVTVNEPQPEDASSTEVQNDGKGNDKDALITQCVEQVMEILNNKNER